MQRSWGRSVVGTFRESEGEAGGDGAEEQQGATRNADQTVWGLEQEVRIQVLRRVRWKNQWRFLEAEGHDQSRSGCRVSS